MPDPKIYTASWLYNPGQVPIAGAALVVRKGVIVAVGPASEIVQEYGPPTAAYPGCVIMPGFVNAHTHLELTHFPAWRLKGGLDYHPRGFADWVVQLVKVKRGVTTEELSASLKAGVAACLRSGTTSVGDILAAPELLHDYCDCNINGQLYLELIGQNTALFEKSLQKVLAAAVAYTGSQIVGLSPHAPYTLSAAVLPSITESAKRGGYRLSLHLAESKAEDQLLFDSTGPLAELLYPLVGWSDYLPAPRRTTPVSYFDQAGLLGPDTLAVHCVQLTPADAALLKERGVSICLCPRSNERLAVGTAPVHLFKKLGIPLCVGTDSLASNDSLSLWDELRFALDIYRGELAPEELLQMATIGGAVGLGLARQVGSLHKGKRADFQVVELEGGCTPENLLGSSRLHEVFLSGSIC
jgi:cytosine/adenosine deaminase-related metal-dependent hydrolase